MSPVQELLGVRVFHPFSLFFVSDNSRVWMGVSKLETEDIFQLFSIFPIRKE